MADDVHEQGMLGIPSSLLDLAHAELHGLLIMKLIVLDRTKTGS